MFIKRIVLCFVLFFSCAQIFCQEEVKAFADSLFMSGFFSEAAGEYKRFLFASKKDFGETEESAVLSLSKIFDSTKDKDGVFWLNKKFEDKVGDGLKVRLNLLNAQYLFRDSKKEELDLFSKEHLTFTPKLLQDLPLYEISLSVLDKNFSNAFSLASAAYEKRSDIEGLNTLATLCKNVKRKSPGIALTLSAFIPGLGKWYGGSFFSGFGSFVSFASLTAGCVYAGYNYGIENWRPWVLGGAALVTYIVELYGSYKNAERYNDFQYNQIYSETENLYESLK